MATKPQLASRSELALKLTPQLADVCVHDFMFQWGGAERVMQELLRISNAPEAITLAGAPAVIRRQLAVPTEVLYPWLRSNAATRAATPLLAEAIPRREPLRGRVICNSYAMAHWVPTVNPRIIYSHSPMRQVWHGASLYQAGWSPEALALRVFGRRLRSRDTVALYARDTIVAPSRRIADIIRQAFGRFPDAIVPPPVADDFFTDVPAVDGTDFVWVGRLVEPIKRLRMLLSAFRELPDRRLVIIGDGRHRRILQHLAPSNISFVGWKEADEVRRIVAESSALLLPSMEDFGVSAAEALAVGTPVITTHAAGISEHITPGVNGLVTEVDDAAFVEALRGFRRDALADRNTIRHAATVFARQEFRATMTEIIEDAPWLRS